jgi:hypothetical protein
MVDDHGEHGVDEEYEQQEYHVDERKHFHPRLLRFIPTA